MKFKIGDTVDAEGFTGKIIDKGPDPVNQRIIKYKVDFGLGIGTAWYQEYQLKKIEQRFKL